MPSFCTAARTPFAPTARGFGLHTHLIEYGPKYSCVALDAGELRRLGLAEVAAQVARDFTLWNQSACSSPHVVFIDDDALAQDFAHELARQLTAWGERLPHGEIPYQEAGRDHAHARAGARRAGAGERRN